jgi:hypothetical protein
MSVMYSDQIISLQFTYECKSVETCSVKLIYCLFISLVSIEKKSFLLPTQLSNGNMHVHTCKSDIWMDIVSS